MNDTAVPQTNFDLTGNTAVITGSSSGIGRQIALRLASAGAHCLIHSRESTAACEEVASQIRKQDVEATVVQADLATAKGQDQLVSAAYDWQNQIDIWINNAGADVLTGAATQWRFEQKLRRLWEVDVMATVRLSRAVGKRMKEQQGCGAILNMGWDRAELGMEGDSGEMFAAAKGAVMAFSRSLARSLAPEVRVNCLAPGWIKTKWAEQASSYWQQRAVGESLMARWGTPEDVAQVAHFLVSPASSFITGQVVPVNGGLKQA